MTEGNPINNIEYLLQNGMELPKCKKCGCMRKSLEDLCNLLPMLKVESANNLLKKVEDWLEQMEEVKYT